MPLNLIAILEPIVLAVFFIYGLYMFKIARST